MAKIFPRSFSLPIKETWWPEKRETGHWRQIAAFSTRHDQATPTRQCPAKWTKFNWEERDAAEKLAQDSKIRISPPHTHTHQENWEKEIYPQPLPGTIIIQFLKLTRGWLKWNLCFSLLRPKLSWHLPTPTAKSAILMNSLQINKKNHSFQKY